ncbi:unnamed protein product [Ectocarpus sp. CCAP 1310/34]|nr:unnamed protein product [Ectocarpus sp. CCAP 1310/34]
MVRLCAAYSSSGLQQLARRLPWSRPPHPP